VDRDRVPDAEHAPRPEPPRRHRAGTRLVTREIGAVQEHPLPHPADAFQRLRRQQAIAQVVDAFGSQVNPAAVAVLGASYGGGQSWLAALQPQFGTPAGAQVRIRTIVPIVPWTDLLGALRPNGDATNSIDVPGSYKLTNLEGLFLGGLRRDRDRPYPNYPDYLFIWNAYILGTEPNNLPPVGSGMADGLAGYRSVYWQQELWNAVRAKTGTADQLPILLVLAVLGALSGIVVSGLHQGRVVAHLQPRLDRPSMAYDAPRQQVILFGIPTGEAAVSQTWAWKNGRWTQLHPPTSPPPRTWAACVGSLYLKRG